jgi:hypothetical protein
MPSACMMLDVSPCSPRRLQTNLLTSSHGHCLVTVPVGSHKYLSKDLLLGPLAHSFYYPPSPVEAKVTPQPDSLFFLSIHPAGGSEEPALSPSKPTPCQPLGRHPSQTAATPIVTAWLPDPTDKTYDEDAS